MTPCIHIYTLTSHIPGLFHNTDQFEYECEECGEEISTESPLPTPFHPKYLEDRFSQWHPTQPIGEES